MAAAPTVLVADLGASSLRVSRVALGDDRCEPVEVHRHAHGPVRPAGGGLRWDWDRLMAELERGLAAGLERGPVASIGIDTWGVDHGLLGADGALLGPPWCHRDERTRGWAAVAERLGTDRLFHTTGVQQTAISTLAQLAVHDRAELAAAESLLLLPELAVHHLTGARTAEVTSAGTTALVDLATGTWSDEILDALGVPRRLLPPIAEPGTPAGTWRGVPVHLVAGHDTASAVLTVPPDATGGTAFVSAGTWLLAGVEVDEPVTSAAARKGAFTNEAAPGGGFRLSRNVAGFWLLDRARTALGFATVEEMADAADAAPPPPVTADAADARFLAPPDMAAELRAASGLGPDAPPAAVARAAVEAMAAGAAAALAEAAALTGRRLAEVHVLGGGARCRPLLRALADRTGLRVVPGPAEATTVGNALVQGVALGVDADIAAARRRLAMAGER